MSATVTTHFPPRRPLPRRLGRRIPALDASDPSEQVLPFVRRLGVSHWLLLLYPVFIYAIQRRRDADAVAEVDSAAILQVGYTAISALWVFYRWFTHRAATQRVLTRTPLRWLGVYCLLAVASTAWSDMVSLTAFRSIQALVFLLVVCDALAALPGLENSIRFQLCFALVAAIFWGLEPLRYEFSIANLHNSMIPGTIAGVAIVGWIARGRQWRVVYAVVALTMLLGTSTATFIAVLVGLAVTMLLIRGKAAGVGLLVLCFVAFLVLRSPTDVFEALFYGKTDYNVQSASGRLPVWQWLLQDVISQRPLLGYGFGCGEVFARLYNTKGLRMMHMHNSVLSALINLGAAGLCLLLLFWAGVFKRAVKRCGLRPVLVGAVVVVVVNSLAMESVSAIVTFGWIAHLLLFGSVALAGNPIKKRGGRSVAE